MVTVINEQTPKKRKKCFKCRRWGHERPQCTELKKYKKNRNKKSYLNPRNHPCGHDSLLQKTKGIKCNTQMMNWRFSLLVKEDWNRKIVNNVNSFARVSALHCDLLKINYYVICNMLKNQLLLFQFYAQESTTVQLYYSTYPVFSIIVIHTSTSWTQCLPNQTKTINEQQVSTFSALFFVAGNRIVVCP